MTKILPSKLVGERITVEFSFLDELQWGETISTSVWSIDVLSGDDLDPELLLYGAPVFLPNSVIVKQRIRGGVPGVLYAIEARVVGSLGTTAIKTAKLGILPGIGIPVPFNATYFTSFIYPAIVTEQVRYTSSIIAASLTRQIVRTFPAEKVRYTASVISSTLGALLIQYHANEKVIYTANVQSSTMDTILRTTSVLEKVIYTPSVVSSTLDTILLHTNVLEKTIYTSSIISSTLTTI